MKIYLAISTSDFSLPVIWPFLDPLLAISFAREKVSRLNRAELGFTVSDNSATLFYASTSGNRATIYVESSEIEDSPVAEPEEGTPC